MTVVLDEFQNAETVEPALVTDLSVLWDKYRKDTQLLLVLTVSDGAGRSMTDGRFSPLCARACGELTLRPFSTGVIKTILTEHYPTRKPDDLLPLFAVTGRHPAVHQSSDGGGLHLRPPNDPARRPTPGPISSGMPKRS